MRHIFRCTHLMEDIFGPIGWIPVKTMFLINTKEMMNSSTDFTFFRFSRKVTVAIRYIFHAHALVHWIGYDTAKNNPTLKQRTIKIYPFPCDGNILGQIFYFGLQCPTSFPWLLLAEFLLAQKSFETMQFN